MDKRPVLYLWRSIRRHIVNRKYKDHLFRIIFHEKTDLLELYNAVNNSSYTDPEALTITTLRDVIFLGMKNDLSFLIGSQLNLYEHQSTWNENMPLRGLFYFSDMLRAFVEDNNLNIHKETKIELPTPRYIVFYNGSDKHPDQVELKLSDAFPEAERESCSVECKVTVMNINKGHNQELMAKSKRLADYAYFVQAVRDNIAQGYQTEEAVIKAVDECIRDGILTDILRRNRAEVIDLFLTTYDAKLHRKAIEEEATERGVARGMEQGMKQGMKQGMEQGIAQERINGCKVLAESYQELGCTREVAVQKLMEKYDLSKPEADQIVKRVWEDKVATEK